MTPASPRHIAVAALLLCSLAARADAYRFATPLGDINVVLRPDVAPATVANFLAYVSRGEYDGSIIHRAVPGFVIQGGGYVIANGAASHIATTGTIASEAGLPNVRGTLAMALSNGPDTATSEWFFNLVDNSPILDGSADGGPFTVFGQVADDASLSVLDAIAGAQIIDGSALFGNGGALNNLPVMNYTSGQPDSANLIVVSSIKQVTSPSAPDFTLESNPVVLAPFAGHSESTTITVTPYNGYRGTVNFSCGPLPASATCTFQPAKLVFSDGLDRVKTAVLIVGTGNAAAARMASAGSSDKGASKLPGGAGGLLAAALLSFGLFGARRSRALGAVSRAASCALAFAFLTSCGSSGSSGTTPPGTYDVKITLTDGASTHPLSLKVIVQ